MPTDDAYLYISLGQFSFINLELTLDKEQLTEIKKDVKMEPIKLNREVWNFDNEGNETNYVLDKGLILEKKYAKK